MTIPQLSGVKLVAAAVGCVAAVALLCLAFWWFFIHPQQAETKAVAAKVESTVANGTAGVAQDALAIRVTVDQQHAAIDNTTQENDRAIHAATGAGDSVGDDLDRAGRAALCLRTAYHGADWCPPVPRSGGGVGPAQPD